MPLVLVLLLAIFAVVANTITGPQTRDQTALQQQAMIMASQMNWYHNAAVRQCQAPATCPVGSIAVSHVFPGARMNFPGYFESANNGTAIVTTWNVQNPMYSSHQNLGGLLSSSLKFQSQGSAYAGPYDARTQTVAGSSYQVYDPVLGYELMTVPATGGGLSLKTGDPILVTPNQ